MKPTKFLVASALSVSLNAYAKPPVNTCRVTGNVVSAQGKMAGDMCRLAEQHQIEADFSEIDAEDPTHCSLEGLLVDAGDSCEVELWGVKVKLPAQSEPDETASKEKES